MSIVANIMLWIFPTLLALAAWWWDRCVYRSAPPGNAAAGRSSTAPRPRLRASALRRKSWKR